MKNGVGVFDAVCVGEHVHEFADGAHLVRRMNGNANRIGMDNLAELHVTPAAGDRKTA